MNQERAVMLRAFGTPVRIRPGFWAAVAALWSLTTWLAGRDRPGRPWPVRLAVGFLSMATLLSADVGHALAHIFSARWAGAPMSEVVLSHGMPRTLYHDAGVSPRAHRKRALGGPLFNAVGLAVALAGRRLAGRESVTREILTWSALGHGLLLAGSLAPLPMVDGGSILKWTLVEGGAAEDEADAIVQRASLAVGGTAAGTGVILAARHHKLAGLGLMAGGVVALAAGLGKVR